MTTDAVVGLVLPVVCSLSLQSPTHAFLCQASHSRSCIDENLHTHITTAPKMLVILSKMPALCSMLSDANYAQNYARLIGAALPLLHMDTISLLS